MQPDDSVKGRSEPSSPSQSAGPEVLSWPPPGAVDAHALAAIDARLDEARSEYQRGNYSAALRILREVTSRLEGSNDRMTDKPAGMALLASAYAVLGRVLPTLSLGDQTTPQLLTRAAEMFERLETSARTASHRYYSEYGIALRLLGRDDRAVRILRQAAEEGTATREALRQLGSLLDERGEYEAAAEFLGRAANGVPTDADVRVALAGVLERADRPAEAARVYREAGWILLEAGQLKAAAVQLDNSLRLIPDSHDTLSLLGHVALLEGQPEKALRALERALAVAPGYYPALIVKARQLAGSGDIVAALEVAKEADAADPKQIAPKTMMAELLEARGEIAQAKSWIEAALALAPDSADLLTRKSRLLWLEGASEEALVLVHRALKLDPDLTPALMLSGGILADLERLQEAEQAFRQVSDLESGSVEALAALGDVYRREGRVREALTVLERALKIEPSHARALATKGQIVLTDQPELATRLLEKALEIDGGLPGAWAALAIACEALGDYDGALEAANRALEREPEDAVLLLSKARLLMRQGRLDEAEGVVTALLRSSPDPVPGLRLKAELCLQLGKYGEVLSLTERALAIEPSLPDALRLRALALLHDGRTEVAIEAFRELLTIEPKLEDGWNWLGEAYRRLNRYDEAEAALDKSLALSKENTFALGTKGQIALAQGKVRKAVKFLTKAVRLDGTLTWARASRGQALGRLGRSEEALEDLSLVLKEEPKHLDAVFDKAEVLMNMGRPAEAVGVIAPWAAEHPILRAQYARALALDGRWAEAGEELQGARGRAPADTYILSVHAQYCCDIGEFAEGAEIAREATAKCNPGSAPFGVLGWALQNLGRTRAEEARQVYEQALRSAPDDPAYRKGLGDALRLLGRTEDARREYQRVLDGAANGPQSAYSHAILAWCRYGLGQYDEAVRLYTLALPRQTDSLPIHFDLALALLASGRSALASEEYSKTVEKANGVHPVRRRGLLYVASYDVNEAQNDRSIPVAGEDPVTRRILSLLQEAFMEAGGRSESLALAF